MGALKEFLDRESLFKSERFIISDRFKDENGNTLVWEIKSVSTMEDERIRKECTVFKKASDGKKAGNALDYEKYSGRLAAKCIVQPNLFSERLQNEYGAFGSDELLKKMLRPGEYYELLKRVSEINGFNSSFSDLADEAKN